MYRHRNMARRSHMFTDVCQEAESSVQAEGRRWISIGRRLFKKEKWEIYYFMFQCLRKRLVGI